jgi:hypothetical protein
MAIKFLSSGNVTGGLTLSGALSGTSATFSGTVTASGTVTLQKSIQLPTTTTNNGTPSDVGVLSFGGDYTTGNRLFVDSSGGTFRIQGSANLQLFAPNHKISNSNGTLILAGDTGVRLYYLNSEKLTTTSTGVKVDGNIKIGDDTMSTPSTNADDIVIDKDASEAGITMMSQAAGSVRWGDASNSSVGSIEYNHNSDYMRLIVNAAERMRIVAAGAVGIDNSSPDSFSGGGSTAASLVIGKGTSGVSPHITLWQGNSAQAALTFASANSGAGQYEGRIRYTRDTGIMDFRTNGVADALVLGSTGNVGIGGTPGQNLDIQKSGARFRLIDGTNQLNMGLWDSVNYRFEGDANRPMFFTSYQGNINFGISGGTTMTIQSGAVGIGTTSPQQKLTLGSVSAGGIQFNYDSTNNYRHQILNYWNSNTDSRMDFNIARTSGQTPETIMSVGYGGNVGIGTSSPTEKLFVDGNNYNTATKTTFVIRDVGNNYSQGDNAVDIVMRSRYWSGDQNTSQNSKIRHLSDNVDGSTGTQLRFGTTTRGSGDSTDKMTILSSGNVGIGTTSPTTPLNVAGNLLVSTTVVDGQEDRFKVVVGGAGDAATVTIHDANETAVITMTGVNGRVQASQGIFGTAFALTNNGYATFGSTGSSVPIAFSIDGDSSSPEMAIDTSGNVGINAATPRDKLTVFTAGSSEEEIGLRLVNPIGFTNAGSGASIIFAQDRSQAENIPMAKIRSSQNAGGSSCCGDLIFSTSHTSLGGMIDRAQITASGIFQVNPDNTVNGGIVNGYRAAISVGQSAVAITNQAQYGGLAMIWMNYVGNIAYDLVSYSLSKSTVLSSQQISGGPAARVYTSVNGVLKATMTGSDTYSFYVSEIRNAMN